MRRMTDDAAALGPVAARAGSDAPALAPAWLYWTVIALVWAGLVAPALIVPFPPLHDYPNHLARVFLLGHLGDSAALQAHYSITWLPYPNLAFDVIGTGLAMVVSPQLAGRLFLVLLPTLFMIGADRLARALHGQPSWSVPLVGFFFFNTLYFYGFLNYVFGVGLYLLAFAWWLQARRGASVARFLLALLGAVACYLAHKTAFAFLAVSVLGSLLLDRQQWSWRGLLRAGAVLSPGVALELFGRVPEVDAPIEWESVLGKLKGVASLISIYRPIWDVGFTVALLLALALVVRGGVRANKSALAIAGALGLLFLILPSGVGGTWAADRRFLLPAATLALLSLRLDLQGRRARLAYASAAGLVLLRAGQVLWEWPGLSQDIQRRVVALQAVPGGARVYGFALLDKKNKSSWTRRMGLVYTHQYALIQSAAVVNGLFVHSNQQPLRERTPVILAQAPGLDVAPEQVAWDVIFAQHDYVFASQLNPEYRRYLAARCQVVGDQVDFALYRGCHR